MKQLRICILDKNPLPKVLGVTAETVLTPLLASIEDKDRFVGCHYENLEDTSKLDAVFLSIGSLNPPDNIWVFLQEDEKPLAERNRLVGAILFQFITYDGQVIPTRWAKELKVMPLSDLQKMVSENKPVVIIAYGAHKADAVFTAYQMGLFNCLIVDRSLAEAILTRLYSTSLTSKGLTSESVLNLPP
ncbi:MAG: sugar-binding domain-containing protein [Candidatus Fervidibacter sp.]|uniref:sugar-binding domain-containing protein n=1 Tax=Candidatus Fervidibacter sp. TaxID=3100871 RepID=UPI00404B3B94